MTCHDIKLDKVICDYFTELNLVLVCIFLHFFLHYAVVDERKLIMSGRYDEIILLTTPWGIPTSYVGAAVAG